MAVTEMNQARVYVIRVEGHLTEGWSDWFEGLAIHSDSDGETTLSGELADQAALFGVLGKIQALNLTLVSVNRAGVPPRDLGLPFSGPSR